MTAIDGAAPVRGAGRIAIEAPRRVVFDLLADVEGWPSWNPDVRSARLDGPLAVGTRFRWAAGPSSITSELVEVAEGESLAWRGRSLGVRAIHVWRLRDTDGGCELATEESMDGLLARLFKGPLRRTLDAAITNGLDAAKREAERRVRVGRT
ncbi:MAG: SRPBCC family protein [Planctomycetota bacterium]